MMSICNTDASTRQKYSRYLIERSFEDLSSDSCMFVCVCVCVDLYLAMQVHRERKGDKIKFTLRTPWHTGTTQNFFTTSSWCIYIVCTKLEIYKL